MHPKLFDWNCSSLFYWQARRDSNPQPTRLERATLPIELLACCYFSFKFGGGAWRWEV